MLTLQGFVADNQDTNSQLDHFFQELQSTSWRIRAQAAKSLADNGIFALSYLVQGALSKRREVRYASAWALGQVHSEAAISVLCQLLDDPEWVVREVATRALGELGDIQALPSLQRARHDQIRRVRTAAIQAEQRIAAT